MGGDLWSQFHENVHGWQPLNNTFESLTRLESAYSQTRENIKQALSSLKVSYTGQASDAMHGAFDTLTDDFNNGTNYAMDASLASYKQASSFAVAQGKIQKPQPVPAAPWYEPIDPFSTDHDSAINANSAIEAANEAAYQQYGSATNDAVNSVRPLPNSSGGFGNFSVQPSGSGSATTVQPPAGAGSQVASRGAADYQRSSGRSTAAPLADYRPPAGQGPVTPGPGVTLPGPGTTSTSGAGAPPAVPVGGGYQNTGAYGPPGGYPPPVGSGGGSPGGVEFMPGGFGSGGGSSDVGGLGGVPGGSSGSSGGRVVGGAGGEGKPGGLAGGRSGMTAGPRSGAGAGGNAGAAAAAAEEEAMSGGAAGRAGTPAMGAMGGRGGRGREDAEHKSASYLVNDDNAHDIVGDIDPVVPPVIGG